MQDRPGIELALGRRARAALPGLAGECAIFVLKQGWASLFGGLLLIALVGTRTVWQPEWPVARYDALFLIAVALQALFLWLRLETRDEFRTILIFHLTGTAMEWFKVAAGSWDYPEPGLLKLWDVPLFSGFLYASVGSYMARVIRICDMRFDPFPPAGPSVALALAIYVNFFSHHFLPDMRPLLFAACLVLFARTRISFRVTRRRRQMPLPVAASLSAIALWLAENAGTLTGTWIYGGNSAGHWAGPAKLGAWFLLLHVAFVTVLLATRRADPGCFRPRHSPLRN